MTAEERENQAAALFRSGKSYQEVADIMGVTKGVVGGLIKRYRERISQKRPVGATTEIGWTGAQNATLREMHSKGHTVSEIAAEVGKNYEATRHQGRRLGLTWANNAPKTKGYSADGRKDEMRESEQRKADQAFIRAMALAFQRGDHLPAGTPKPLVLVG